MKQFVTSVQIVPVWLAGRMSLLFSSATEQERPNCELWKECFSKFIDFTSGDGSSPPFCRVTFGKTRKHQNKRVTLTLTGKPIYASGRNTVVLCSGTPTHRADVSASSENRAVYYCKAQESNWSSWQRLKRDYQRRGQTPEQGQELQKLRSQTEELFVLIYLSGLSCVLIRGRSVEV